MGKEKTDSLWFDRKRILGLPISFTKYYVKNNRLYYETGLLSTERNEIMLYRILDLKEKQTLADKLFGVGTITLYTMDESNKEMIIKNIKNPSEVMDMLSGLVEEQRAKNKVRVGEVMREDDGLDDSSLNG
jgi:uncharacterized membrane protein YdbT with pleckstrin-like domain